jgi:hypothetical protein
MHMFRSPAAFAVAGAILLCAAPAAAAVPIQGLYNTGVDDAGGALAGGNGVVDPHYLIVASTTPGYAGQHAVTYAHPSYVANDADSRWVSLSATGSPGANTTTYRLTFDLAGLDPATAQITGYFGVDNILEVFLNGVANPVNPGSFGGLTGFSVTSGFAAGLNSLDFRITDQGEPTAFRIDNLAGTANVLQPPPVGGVPEPTTWAMMLTGFFGMGGALRTRRRRASALA